MTSTTSGAERNGHPPRPRLGLGIGDAIAGPIDRLIRWADQAEDVGCVHEPSAQSDEMLVERKLRSRQGASRPNTIAVVSPKGGVGKTTCAFVLGNVLASHAGQRVVAVDATTELGMLSDVVPDELRSDRSLVDVLRDGPDITNVAAIQPYVSRLPTGLHVLSAPRDPATAARLTAGHYEALARLLSVFYEIVLFDAGPGLQSPAAQFAAHAADQLVLVTTPESLTARAVLGSLEQLPADRTAVVLNMTQPGTAWDAAAIERHCSEGRPHQTATIPFDEHLLCDLDRRSYELDRIDTLTRTAIMRLAVQVCNRLA